MIRTDDLNLVATRRVMDLSQPEVNQLVRLLAEHLKTFNHIDRDTFLMLANEAEAVSSW